MATLSEALDLAIQHHKAGELAAAEQIYRQILVADPNQVDSLHLLGVIAFQTGQHELAVKYIRRAIELNPTEPAFHTNLGHAFGALRKPDESVACFQRAFELKPNDADALKNLSDSLQTLGRTDEAVACFRQALARTADFAEVSNLGNVLHNQGRFDEAVFCFHRALELLPNSAEVHSNLGNAYQAQGKLNEAIESYRRALDRKPDFAEAHYNLGNALNRVGKLEEAIAAYRQALQHKSDLPEAHHNLGRIFEAQERFDEAAACFHRALMLNPQFAAAHNNLGNVLCVLGKPAEAVSYYRRAVELKTDFAQAFSNLGNSLRILGKLDEAIAFCRRALELNPNNADAHKNLGNAFQAQGNLSAAIDSYRRVMELKPHDADARSNLGSALQQMGQFASATTCYAQALQLNENCAFAHFGRATLNLLHGHFESGWQEFEWRWKTTQLGPREFTLPGAAGNSVPRWDGNPLAKQTILLHAEEAQGGLGDTLQFVRYAALIKKQNAAATVIVECQRPLAKLLSRCPDFDRLIPRGDELPPFDVHAPLTSVPGILKTSLETIPAEVPYLFADPQLIDEWRKKLEPVRGLRIGINWRARPITRYRNIPLECFTRLTDIPGLTFVGLQKGARQELSAASGNDPPFVDLGDGFDTARGAFMDTAAVMMNLDLVISSDTAIPHLAGALGVPVWLVLSKGSDWRWLLGRSDSPWYPTMRLFRQKTPDDWNEVFDEIRAALRNFAPGAR